MKLTPPSCSHEGALRLSLCAGAIIGSLSLFQSQAAAQTLTGPCSDLPNAIYGIGGSAATTLIKRVAEILYVADEPITVIYQDPGACQAMDGLVNGTLMTGVAKYWNPRLPATGPAGDETCTLPTAGVVAEWGAMAQLASTCTDTATSRPVVLPNTVGDYLSVNSGFSLVVGADSAEQVISAEALHRIYTDGAAAAGIEPWTVDALLASRTTSSAAGLLLAKAVGIPLTRALAGNDDKNQSGVIKRISEGAATTNPDATLGFVSTEAAEASSAITLVRSLAYQHQGQDFGYYPNSTTTSKDKLNIREGHYFLWNPHHFFARTNASGDILNPNLAKFISYVTFEEPLPGDRPFIDVAIANGNIPSCAMHVTRDDDMGPLASYQPDEPCGCYFDSKTDGAGDSCTECATDDDCGADAPKCRYGYCEVK